MDGSSETICFLLIPLFYCSLVVALLCLTFSPNLAVGLKCIFRHVHVVVPVLQEAVELLRKQLKCFSCL